MASPLDDSALAQLRAPSLEDLEVLADAAFASLPSRFTRLCEGLVIHVEDFPDEEILEEMECESEFDLLGLFRGQGLAQREASAHTGEPPNMVWLYAVRFSTIGRMGRTLCRRSSPMSSCMRSATTSASPTRIWKRSSRRPAEASRGRRREAQLAAHADGARLDHDGAAELLGQ